MAEGLGAGLQQLADNLQMLIAGLVSASDLADRTRGRVTDQSRSAKRCRRRHLHVPKYAR